MLATIALLYLVSFGLLAAMYLMLRRAGGLSSQFFVETETAVGLPASAPRRTDGGRGDATTRTGVEYRTAH